MTVIRVKGVPDEVRDVLVAEAGEAGRSLQAHLLGVLEREARFARNRRIVAETPILDTSLSMDEIVAAVRAFRGVSDPGGGSGTGAV